MLPYKHQMEKAAECWEILKVYGYVYLAGKPRSGKTYTAIQVAETSSKINSVLVLTPKAAINGWLKFTENNTHLKHRYYITNYEQAHKLVSRDYDLVIIDESHNLGTLAKPSQRIKTIKKLCYNMPHIHLSGTAIVESPNSIFHQMGLSKYTPFKHKNFYSYFKEFGEPYYIKVSGREITQYDRCKLDKLMPIINGFTVYMTQEDGGISKDVQAVDKLHYIELGKDVKNLYNKLQEHNIADVYRDTMFWEDGTECEKLDKQKLSLVCDTEMKLRTSLHMLESGVVKMGDEYIELGNREKVNYVKKVFGDNGDVGIMCNFVGERRLLAKFFDYAELYSSSAHAEGVDLSHLKYFIIFSSNYSGSKFIQRRDRIINTEGSNTTTVHHLLVKKAISEQVYKKVSKKQDFNNSTYEKATL